MIDLTYQSQFNKKVDLFNRAIEPYTDQISCFPSKATGFRTRIEFGISKFSGKLNFSMSENSKRVEVKEMPICNSQIRKLMPELMNYLNTNKQFSEKLFQIEFQVSRKKDAMISMIYHKNLNSEWEKEAEKLSKIFDSSIIGRSHKQCIIKGNNFVLEKYKSESHQYSLKLYEQCFSQTNPDICDDMLTWVENSSHAQDDILELYCGLGTFTILFSRMYKSVLATENSRPNILGLNENLLLNNVNNVWSARLSGYETLDAIKKTRSYRRMKDIDLSNFKLSTIFLDPPRSGLDDNTLNAVSNYDQIIYLSCGFDSLTRDLSLLGKTHKVRKAAMFDQFPFTAHLESGLVLEKK